MKAFDEFETVEAYKAYLRTYVAAMCLQGLLANPEMLTSHKEVDMARAAVRAADGLLKELEN